MTQHSDPLLECLVYLTGHFGRARSASSITAGLAYDGNGMGPNLFCQAAERLKIKARFVQRRLADIPAPVLPCVLVLGAQAAAVLLSVDTKKDTAMVYFPELGGEKAVPLKDLEKAYKGRAIFLHPETAPVEDRMTGRAMHDPRQHWFWGVVRTSRRTYVQVGVAALLINVFALAGPLFMMNVYDRIIPNQAFETGWVLAIGVLTVYGFDFLMRSLRAHFLDLSGRKIDVVVGRRIFDQLMDMKLSARPKSSGAFASMLRDFDSVKEFFTSSILTAFVDLPFSLIFLAFIFLVSTELGLIALAVLLVTAGISFLLQKPMRYLTQKSMAAAEAKHGILVETISGLETIKAIGADGAMRAKYADYAGESATVSQTTKFFSNLTLNIAVILQQSCSVLMILCGMYLVKEQAISVGALIACVIMAGRATAPVGQIAALISRYHASRNALATLNRIMEAPVDRPADKNFVSRPELAGKITFQKVSFAYPGTDRKVLDGLSFTVNQGEKVGIVGRIGSGKSTIARLVMGLYEPGEGAMLIDDTDYRQIDPADIRRNIAYIPQDVVLLSGTVRDNIAAGFAQATDAEILAAAKAAGVHDFISRHPRGYDAMVGERGEGLSGGQRQAVALARAILTSPGTLVCDEPTNAMDIQTEEAFTHHIRESAKDKTLILITHRQPLLRLVDRLIIIDNGAVVADGPREKVIEALSGGGIEVRKGGPA